MARPTVSTLLLGICFVVCAPMFARGADSSRPLVRTGRLPEGGVNAQGATDRDGVIHLVYFKGDPMHGDVFYVRSNDRGESFSKPVRVNSQDESVILVGTVRGPQMAVGKGGRVHVSWMGSDKALPKAKGRQTPMLYTRLNDAGDAFEPQRNIIQDHPGLDGGGSVAADEAGNVYVAWHAPRREQTEEDRHIWVVRSDDEGRTFGPETMADPDAAGVCGCCGMRIGAGPGPGEVYVLYRTATKNIHRDMRVLASTDFGRTFKVAAVHPWSIGQCAMSTSAFAPSSARAIAAWETRQQIYVAGFQRGAAVIAPFGMPGDGNNRKHPALASNNKGQVVVAWTEDTGWNKGGIVRWQVYDQDGAPVAGLSGTSGGLPAWGVPAVLASPDGTFRVLY